MSGWREHLSLETSGPDLEKVRSDVHWEAGIAKNCLAIKDIIG